MRIQDTMRVEKMKLDKIKSEHLIQIPVSELTAHNYLYLTNTAHEVIEVAPLDFSLITITTNDGRSFIYRNNETVSVLKEGYEF